MSDNSPPAEGITEEVEDEMEIFCIGEDFHYSSYVFDTETAGNIDVIQIGDRLGELNEEYTTVLRRTEICEWFAELPEEEAPEQSRQMKQLINSGGDIPAALVSLAYHTKIASAYATIASTIETKQHRRELLERDRIENPNDEHPELEEVPTMNSFVNMYIFQGFPATLSELQVFQSPETWLPEQAISKTASAVLNSVIIINSSNSFKRAATSEADKAPGKPDPKKAKGKGKSSADSPEQQSGIAEILLKEISLHEGEQNSINELYVQRYNLRSSWFGTAIADTEANVYDHISQYLEDMDSDLRQYHTWLIGKDGYEVCIPALQSLVLPPKPVVKKRDSVQVDTIPQKAKGVSTTKKTDESIEVVDADIPGEEPSPSISTPKTVKEIACHRKYYDTLMKSVLTNCSIPALMSCIIHQVVRSEECRRKVSTISIRRKSDNPFDLDEDVEQHSEPDQESELLKDVTIVEAKIENELSRQESIHTEKSLLDYIDFILGKVEGAVTEVISAKKNERIEAENDIKNDLESYTKVQTNILNRNSSQQVSRQFKLGCTIKVIHDGEHFDTVGTVIGHGRGRVGVQLATGEIIGFLPTEIMLTNSSNTPEGIVHYTNRFAVNRISCVDSCIHGLKISDIDNQAIEHCSNLIPKFNSELVLKTDDIIDDGESVSGDVTSLPPQQITRQLILFALEQLYADNESDQSSDSIPKPNFATRVYTEDLNRQSYLQLFSKAKQLGCDTKSTWYDQSARQGLVIHAIQFDPSKRYKWHKSLYDLRGKVYFSCWMKWQKTVREYERGPLESPTSDEAEEEAEEEKPEEGDEMPTQEETSEKAEEENNHDTEVPPQQELPVTPVQLMDKMRKAAEVEILKNWLQPGPSQCYYHTLPGAVKSISEQQSTLYPSDGGIIQSSVFSGNEDFSHCSITLPGLTAGMRTSLTNKVSNENPSQNDTEITDRKNPTYFTATFDDESSLYLGSRSSVTSGNVIVSEYTSQEGLHTRVHSTGIIEMTKTLHIPEQLSQNIPTEELKIPEGDITVDNLVIEPTPLVDVNTESHPNTLIQVYNEITNTVSRIVTQEICRRITITGSVIRNMSDGTISTLMPNGTVVTVYLGSWLITKNGSRYVIRRGTSDPVQVPPGLLSRCKDTETKALIVTRDDLTLSVENEQQQGSRITSFTDGTTIWSKRQITVEDSPDCDVGGDYTPNGSHKNGAVVFINIKNSVELFKNDDRQWEFSTIPPSIGQEQVSCPSMVTRWVCNCQAVPLVVSSLRQTRLESPSYASVEISFSDNVHKVQVSLPSDTILLWSSKTSTTVVKNTSEDDIISHIPSRQSVRSLQLFKQDLTTILIDIETQTVTVHASDSEEESSTGYNFKLLEGILSTVDSDKTTYKISTRGNIYIKPFDGLSENYPEGDTPDGLIPDIPVDERFSTIAKVWNQNSDSTAGIEPTNGTLIVETPQHPTALVKGGLKPAVVSHPPQLYSLDLKKGIATRYLSAKDVINHIRFASSDSKTSITTSSIPGTDSEEICIVTTVVPNLCTKLTDKLLPRVVLETQQNASRAPRNLISKRLIESFNKTTRATCVPQKRQQYEIRRELTKHAEVSEADLKLIKLNTHRLRNEEKIRMTHTANLKITDAQTTKEEADEVIVNKKLSKILTQLDADAQSPESEVPQQDNTPRVRAQNIHDKHANEIDDLQSQQLSFWHTEDGLKQAEVCLLENVKYKKTHDQEPLIPSPPPKETKPEASPHSSSVTQVVEQIPDPLINISKLEPIVEAGPHKQSLDIAKVLLRKPSPSDTALSVFCALCILLGESPSLDKCRQLVGSSDFYLRVLKVAENRDFLPENTLTSLLPYVDHLYPDTVAESMVELAAVSNWILSFIYYLEALREAGGPAGLEDHSEMRNQLVLWLQMGRKTFLETLEHR